VDTGFIEVEFFKDGVKVGEAGKGDLAIDSELIKKLKKVRKQRARKKAQEDGSQEEDTSQIP
jgi:hypothetical protein